MCAAWFRASTVCRLLALKVPLSWKVYFLFCPLSLPLSSLLFSFIGRTNSWIKLICREETVLCNLANLAMQLFAKIIYFDIMLFWKRCNCVSFSWNIFNLIKPYYLIFFNWKCYLTHTNHIKKSTKKFRTNLSELTGEQIRVINWVICLEHGTINLRSVVFCFYTANSPGHMKLDLIFHHLRCPNRTMESNKSHGL